MGRKKKQPESTVPFVECCSRAKFTYPYLNEIVCINCGTFRVKLPPREESAKTKKKK